MSLGQVVAGCQDDCAYRRRAAPVIPDIPFVEQHVEATGNHGFQQRIFVGVVIVESGAIDSGGLGDVLHSDLVEALILHEVTQSTLKELPRSSDSWISYFAVGDGHGSLSLEDSKENKEKKNPKTTHVVYYRRHKLSKHL